MCVVIWKESQNGPVVVRWLSLLCRPVYTVVLKVVESGPSDQCLWFTFCKQHEVDQSAKQWGLCLWHTVNQGANFLARATRCFWQNPLIVSAPKPEAGKVVAGDTGQSKPSVLCGWFHWPVVELSYTGPRRRSSTRPRERAAWCRRPSCSSLPLLPVRQWGSAEYGERIPACLQKVRLVRSPEPVSSSVRALGSQSGVSVWQHTLVG